MAFITWDNSYSVSVKSLDDQHLKLVEIINQFHAFVNMGESVDALKTTVKNLKEYSNVHFKAEEELLAKHNYNQLEEHKKLHSVYIAKLEEIEKMSKKEECTSEVMFFMKDWLMNHILIEDKKYTNLLKD